jgi:ParB/RepB/Spo0J family partition protein
MNIYNELIVNLKTDSSNPNKMTKEQIQSVANSIKKFGFLVPIIVNKDNVIIDGHQRLKAADLLGMEEVPVVKLDVDKIDAKLLKQIMNKLKGTHDFDLDLEEYKAILEAQGNLDSLKDFVAMNDEYINNILKEIEIPAEPSDLTGELKNKPTMLHITFNNINDFNIYYDKIKSLLRDCEVTYNVVNGEV